MILRPNLLSEPLSKMKCPVLLSSSSTGSISGSIVSTFVLDNFYKSAVLKPV